MFIVRFIYIYTPFIRAYWINALSPSIRAVEKQSRRELMVLSLRKCSFYCFEIKLRNFPVDDFIGVFNLGFIIFDRFELMKYVRIFTWCFR